MYRLRGSDAQTIYTETPTSPFVTLKVMIYEPISSDDVPSYKELKNFIKNGIQSWCSNGLSMRVIRVPFDIHHPIWVPDSNFNLDDHIHNVALPAPGNNEKLCEFISYILSMPMDQKRPLWDSWVVEGLEGGRIAWFCKVHHVHADGIMSVDQIIRLHTARRSVSVDDPFPRCHLPPPKKSHLITSALIDLFKSYSIELPGIFRNLRKARLARPKPGSRNFEEGVVSAFSAPYTIFNAPGGHYRNFEYQTFSLRIIKLIAKKYGCTINTLVLTIVSEVILRYLSEMKQVIPDTPLVIVMPVSKKKSDNSKVFLNTEIHNNNLALAFVSMDLRIRSFDERLLAIQKSSEIAMQHVRITDGRRIDNFSDYLPGSLFRILNWYISRRQRLKRSVLANFSVSNVPGPQEQLYACDGRLKMVDLLSCGNLMDINAFGVTVWSYLDKFSFNLLFRKGVLPKQNRISELFDEVYGELYLSTERHDD